MKLSNKILLGILLFAVAVIVLHYISLLMMWKSGHYTERYSTRDREPQRFFPEHIHTVSITGFGNVQLVMSDTFYYEVYYAETNKYGGGIDTLRNRFVVSTSDGELVMQGDTFTVDTVMREDRLQPDTTFYRNENMLVIHVTGREKVIAEESALIPKRSYKEGNFNLQLHDANLGLQDMVVEEMSVYADAPPTPYDENQGKYIYTINRLVVDASGNCQITLPVYMRIGELILSMGNGCSFNDAGCRIQKGSIQYADSASLNLKAWNFKNLQWQPRGNVD